MQARMPAVLIETSPRTPAPFEAPTHFGQYEVVAPLATTSVAQVFVGRHANPEGPGRLVAIKLLHEDLVEGEAARNALLEEARLTSVLRHPNVVGVLEMDWEQGQPYVVTEYIDGCSLHDLMDVRHQPVECVLPILVDVLRGLHAVHALRPGRGLVHRDVSPHNILVGLDGVGRIKDFGIAQAEGRASNTAIGTRRGKLAFMSPEQVRGDELDRRSDVFGAGAVLWAVLTGQNLFRRSDMAATMLSVLHDPIPAPSSVFKGLPERFDEVCLRALSRDRTERYVSAEEFAEELEFAARREELWVDRREVRTWVGNSCPSRVFEGECIEVTGELTGDVLSQVRPIARLEPVEPAPRRRLLQPGSEWVLLAACLVATLLALVPGDEPDSRPPVAVDLGVAVTGPDADKPPTDSTSNPQQTAALPAGVPSPAADAQAAPPGDNPSQQPWSPKRTGKRSGPRLRQVAQPATAK